jgi:hypothetical protein
VRKLTALLAGALIVAAVGLASPTFAQAGSAGTSDSTRPMTRRSQAAWCRVSASYNHTYRDYDVYIHSNQPHRDARVTDSHGDSWGYPTNGKGYADVYLYVNGNPNGQKVTVEVGRARCDTYLS